MTNIGNPRWALWNYETRVWDEIRAENIPGEWVGGHHYGVYDNPEFDATDGAHPAWWRGNDHGWNKAQDKIKELEDRIVELEKEV